MTFNLAELRAEREATHAKFVGLEEDAIGVEPWSPDEDRQAAKRAASDSNRFERQVYLNTGDQAVGWYICSRRKQIQFCERAATPQGRDQIMATARLIDGLEHDLTGQRFDASELARQIQDRPFDPENNRAQLDAMNDFIDMIEMVTAKDYPDRHRFIADVEIFALLI